MSQDKSVAVGLEPVWLMCFIGCSSLSPHEPTFALVDSMPFPVCLFARAYRCRRFRGEAAFGKDTLLKQTFYGFRVHVRVCWPGGVTRFSVAPANVHELSVLPEITRQPRV